MFVTDLTYVSVKQHWHYLCVMVDVSNRQIVGQSTGKHKIAHFKTKSKSKKFLKILLAITLAEMSHIFANAFAFFIL